MKKLIVLSVMSIVLWSCGGSGDDPVPEPQENNAPSVPVQSSPVNNLLCIDNNVAFQWSAATDPDGDAVRYLLEIAENNTFSPVAHSVTVSSNNTSVSLEKGVAYYWRVKAIDSKNASSAFTSSYQFYTEGEGVVNHLPFTPSLVKPALNTVESNATAVLEWTASDVDTEDVLSYDVYFGTDNPPTVKQAENLSVSNLEVQLDASEKYYWSVIVKDGNGGEAVSQVWSFKTD